MTGSTSLFAAYSALTLLYVGYTLRLQARRRSLTRLLAVQEQAPVVPQGAEPEVGRG